jgi:flagellar motor switch protein FliN/FliY|tara:strand:- start:1368 stop:1703 length:336 start_codon:yes stop_codon:yes gene_type:complete
MKIMAEEIIKNMEEINATGDSGKTVGIENLKVLENIDVELTVEVGRTEITIRDLLRLNEGSVVELDRLAGDPLDILVNNTKIAKGEVVMIGERFGVRFGEIVEPEKRMESI